jgi:hypothetical protein
VEKVSGQRGTSGKFYKSLQLTFFDAKYLFRSSLSPPRGLLIEQRTGDLLPDISAKKQIPRAAKTNLREFDARS